MTPHTDADLIAMREDAEEFGLSGDDDAPRPGWLGSGAVDWTLIAFLTFCIVMVVGIPIASIVGRWMQ